MKEYISFCTPFYEKKDEMHNISHVDRVMKKAKELAQNIPYDWDMMQKALYLHGLLDKEEQSVKDFLKTEPKADLIFQISKESIKSSMPKTKEGALLHDAHLLEGEDDFLFIKSVKTGIARGQTIQETADYYKDNLYMRFVCFDKEHQRKYLKRDERAMELWRSCAFVTQNKEIEKGLLFAANAFQVTHNPKPALLHSIRVAGLLYELGYDTELVQAAILHDVVEDTKTTAFDIEKTFGKTVADLVRALTLDPFIKDYKARYVDGFDKIKNNKKALIIRSADLTDNADYIHLADKELQDSLIKKYIFFYVNARKKMGDEKIWAKFEGIRNVDLKELK